MKCMLLSNSVTFKAEKTFFFSTALSNGKPLNSTLKKLLQLQMNLNRFLLIITLEV